MHASKRGLLALVAAASLLVSGSPASADASSATRDMTAEMVLDFARMSSAQRGALARGEIVVVMTGDSATVDVTPSNLYSGLAMWVPQPLGLAVSAVDDPAPRASEAQATAVEIPASAAIPRLDWNSDHREEIERILAFTEGRSVNLGESERARLQSLRITPPLQREDISRFGEAYRASLQQRFVAYRENGLRGIEGYIRGEGVTKDIGDDLRRATERAVQHIAKFFPDFCAQIERFPETGSMPHRYLLVRDTWEGRPQWVLVHRIADVSRDRALFLHREFFVSQGYDALQVLILLVPYEQGTLIALSTDVFTDEVAGFASGLLHRVGRNRVRKSAMMRLEQLRMAIAERAAAGEAAARSTR